MCVMVVVVVVVLCLTKGRKKKGGVSSETKGAEVVRYSPSTSSELVRVRRLTAHDGLRPAHIRVDGQACMMYYSSKVQLQWGPCTGMHCGGGPVHIVHGWGAPSHPSTSTDGSGGDQAKKRYLNPCVHACKCEPLAPRHLSERSHVPRVDDTRRQRPGKTRAPCARWIGRHRHDYSSSGAVRCVALRGCPAAAVVSSHRRFRLATYVLPPDSLRMDRRSRGRARALALALGAQRGGWCAAGGRRPARLIGAFYGGLRERERERET
jgi:hypothetical protein